MRLAFASALASAVLLAGCDTGVTSVDLTALSLEIDDYRASAEQFLDAQQACFEMAKIDLNEASLTLCNRAAVRSLGEQAKLVVGLMDNAYQKADEGSSCEAQLLTIGKRATTAVEVAFSTNLWDDSTDVSSKLDRFDRAFDRIESAFVRAEELCGEE